MQGQEFFSTTKKLAILDNAGLAEFAKMNRNDPILIGMAINEKNRRDALKQNQIAQSAPMGPQPTVVESEIGQMAPQQMASQGIAGLPAPTMEAMGQRASSGGIMRYAGGGFTNVQIIEMVREEAARRGINPDTAERILRIENSKLDPKASPKTSSAFGLFQTTEDTWKSLGGDPKKKDSVEEQIRVGLNLIQDNDTKLGDSLGRQPTPSESYAAHFFGLGNALKVLNAEPGAKIEDIVGAAAVKANPELLKGKTAGDVMGTFTQKMGVEPAKEEVPAQLSAASVPTAAGIKREEGERQAARAAEAQRIEEEGVGQKLLGVGEAGLTALTGALSIPVAGVGALTGIGRREGETEEQALARMTEAMTYAPRTEAGQRMTGELGRVIEESKLPPFMPGLTGMARSTPARRGALQDAALLAGKADEAQAAAAATQRAATPVLQSPEAAARAARQRAAGQQAQAELSASERVLGTTPRDLAAAQAEQAAAIKASQAYRSAREARQLQNEIAAGDARLRALGVDTKEPPVQRQPRNLVMEAQETATRARLSPLEQKVRGLQGILDEKKQNLAPTAADVLAAEQRAEAAARSSRLAREKAAAELPKAQERAAGALTAADEAAARAGAMPGRQTSIAPMAPTPGLALARGQGGLRDIAPGAAAPAAEPDFEYGDPNVLAFARGQEPDPEYGDPGVLASYRQAGKQVIDSLPKEEKEGLAGLLGRIDNDLYTAMGIGLLSGSNWQEGLALGGQLYMKRKDAKLAREAKSKETASEIAEREARTAESRARTEVLTSGVRQREAALKQASTDYNKWLGTAAGIVATPAQQRQKLMELQSQQLAQYGLTPVGMGVESSSAFPGFKLLGQ